MTGACGLQDLPTHVLYKLTSSLDPHSQRSLFLSSSQLYKKWHLQLPTDQRHWQFVQQSVNLLAATTLEGSCDKEASRHISVHLSGEIPWGKISCQQKAQSLRFELAHSTEAFPGGCNQADYTGMTEAQLWHRLTAVPNLAFASVTLKSTVVTVAKLKRFAKQSFDLLCNARGFLTFYMMGLEDSSEELEPGYHALKVLHAVHNGREYWELDGEDCIVTPPKIDFHNMPTEVVSVHAEFVSEGPPAQEYLSPNDPEAYFYPDSNVISDFAYQGNVDIDAWVEMMHETANDWYENMDAFAEDEQDLDDMDDLDDAAMAQLLGAMQG